MSAVKVTVYLPGDLADEVERMALASRRSFSNQLAALVAEALERP